MRRRSPSPAAPPHRSGLLWALACSAVLAGAMLALPERQPPRVLWALPGVGQVRSDDLQAWQQAEARAAGQQDCRPSQPGCAAGIQLRRQRLQTRLPRELWLRAEALRRGWHPAPGEQRAAQAALRRALGAGAGALSDRQLQAAAQAQLAEGRLLVALAGPRRPTVSERRAFQRAATRPPLTRWQVWPLRRRQDGAALAAQLRAGAQPRWAHWESWTPSGTLPAARRARPPGAVVGPLQVAEGWLLARVLARRPARRATAAAALQLWESARRGRADRRLTALLQRRWATRSRCPEGGCR